MKIPMDSGKRITLKEIARRAEASTMAVSVVLNGARSTARVADSTRERILSVAANLNYTPNAMARGLRRQRTNTIGVLFNWAGSGVLHNLYSASILDGIVAGAAETGYHVLLYTEPWRNAEISSALFSDQRTDGIVVVAPEDNSDVVSGLVALGLPVTVVSSVTEVEGVPYITIDNRNGIRLALDHLWELGHRRIAYVGHHMTRDAPRQRYETYQTWMNERGLPMPDASLLSTLIPYNEEPPIEQVLSREPDSRPTAIMAFNDQVAARVLTVARKLGLTLPKDLSVVGFDDVIVASLTVPALTTVRQPLFEMGQNAAKLLAERIEKSDTIDFEPAHVLTPELIVRDSTAPPRF